MNWSDKSIWFVAQILGAQAHIQSERPNYTILIIDHAQAKRRFDGYFELKWTIRKYGCHRKSVGNGWEKGRPFKVKYGFGIRKAMKFVAYLCLCNILQ